MSKRGATHRGGYFSKKHHIAKSRKGQRNRRKDDKTDGRLADVPSWLVAKMVRTCRSKVAYKSQGSAYAAKVACENRHGGDYSIYECPICGKWHLTTHPRSHGLD